MAGFGEVQEQYTKDLERDLKQARKEINDLKSKLAELREAYNFNLDLLSNQKNELAEARKGITDAMDCLDCDSIAYIILKELKEKDDE